VLCAAVAGVANPFSLGRLAAGERDLDLGCGAGTDSLVAAQMVGPSGTVVGIDMTPAMLAKARHAAAELGVANADFIEGEVESLPFPDESFGCWRCRRWSTRRERVAL
jgi:arsenite methyltransferase